MLAMWLWPKLNDLSLGSLQPTSGYEQPLCQVLNGSTKKIRMYIMIITINPSKPSQSSFAGF